MKNYYFFLLFIAIYFQSFSQSCSDAEPDINYAYSHVKSAYDSNNFTHLKYYAKRSFDAFERAKKKLKDCSCTEAYNLAYDAHNLLSKLPNARSYEDGRFYVKRAREVAQNTIQELELCSKLSHEDEALAALEYEQQKLKEQQEKLKQKEAEIKQMLAQKELKELRLKKEKLINLNEQAITSSINSLNEVLSACDCGSQVSNTSTNADILLSKSVTQIKEYYLDTIKAITSKYLSTLNNCKI